MGTVLDQSVEAVNEHHSNADHEEFGRSAF